MINKLRKLVERFESVKEEYNNKGFKVITIRPLKGGRVVFTDRFTDQDYNIASLRIINRKGLHIKIVVRSSEFIEEAIQDVKDISFISSESKNNLIQYLIDMYEDFNKQVPIIGGRIK